MEDDYTFCYECEENFNCPDACKMDGCEYGIKSDNKEGENTDETLA